MAPTRSVPEPRARARAHAARARKVARRAGITIDLVVVELRSIAGMLDHAIALVIDSRAEADALESFERVLLKLRNARVLLDGQAIELETISAGGAS